MANEQPNDPLPGITVGTKQSSVIRCGFNLRKGADKNGLHFYELL